jgi:hypothetical protein
MSASPPNAHAISAIRERLAKVSGELIAIEKQWRALREAHHALSQTLRMFDPSDDLYQIRPKRPYRRVVSGKLSLLVLDALRASGGPMRLSEVVAALGERVNAIPDTPERVLASLNYLARSRGAVTVEGKREEARWSLALSAKRGTHRNAQ